MLDDSIVRFIKEIVRAKVGTETARTIAGHEIKATRLRKTLQFTADGSLSAYFSLPCRETVRVLLSSLDGAPDLAVTLLGLACDHVFKVELNNVELDEKQALEALRPFKLARKLARIGNGWEEHGWDEDFKISLLANKIRWLKRGQSLTRKLAIGCTARITVEHGLVHTRFENGVSVFTPRKLGPLRCLGTTFTCVGDDVFLALSHLLTRSATVNIRSAAAPKRDIYIPASRTDSVVILSLLYNESPFVTSVVR